MFLKNFFGDCFERYTQFEMREFLVDELLKVYLNNEQNMFVSMKYEPTWKRQNAKLRCLY